MVEVAAICLILIIFFVAGSSLLKPNFSHDSFKELKSYEKSHSLHALTGSRYSQLGFEQGSKLNLQDNISKKINIKSQTKITKLLGHKIRPEDSIPHSWIPETILNDNEIKIELRVPGVEVSPTSRSSGWANELLVCAGAFPIPSLYVGWTIVRVVPKINVIGIHHMIAYGTTKRKSEDLEPEVVVDYNSNNGCMVDNEDIFFCMEPNWYG